MSKEPEISYEKPIMLLSILFSFLTVTALTKPEIEHDTVELQVGDCNKLMRNMEFKCREVYSPYLCKHFLKHNMKMLNEMMQQKYGAHVNCLNTA